MSCTGGVNLSIIEVWGAQSRVLGHPITIWRRYHGHSPHLVWHIWWWWVWIGGEYADGYIGEYEGVHAGVFGINETIFQANLFGLTS